MQVKISDNGQGFDPAAHAEGNGLVNFRKRAHEGGFTVWVQSEVGVGTTIALQVSIQKAEAISIHPPISL